MSTSWTGRTQPSKGTPSREAANAAQDATLTTNERILRDIHDLYVDAGDGGRAREEPVMNPAALRPGKEGIMAICSKLGMSCIAPRRKINVMIVGARYEWRTPRWSLPAPIPPGPGSGVPLVLPTKAKTEPFLGQHPQPAGLMPRPSRLWGIGPCVPLFLLTKAEADPHLGQHA
jgi:hypothetical protein